MTVGSQPSGRALRSRPPRRIEPLARVAMEATLEMFGGRAPAYVFDLSCNGAMIQMEQPPRQGGLVILTCGPLSAVGKVMWSLNERFGLAFYDPIEEHQVTQLRRIADRAAHHGPATLRDGRPGLAVRPLTWAERKIAEEWATASWYR